MSGLSLALSPVSCCCCCDGACADQVFNFAQMAGDVTSQFHVTSEDGNVFVTDGQAVVTGSPLFDGTPAVYRLFDSTVTPWVLEMSGTVDADGAFFGWGDFVAWAVFVVYVQGVGFDVRSQDNVTLTSFGLSDKFGPWHIAISYDPVTGDLTPMLDLIGGPVGVGVPADPTSAPAFFASGVSN